MQEEAQDLEKRVHIYMNREMERHTTAHTYTPLMLSSDSIIQTSINPFANQTMVDWK
jgi:hypothetical protein